MKLTDADIRESLIPKIIKENQDNEYRLVEELAICDHKARADIALINGILKGYEIKSDLDTLDRLPNQVEMYDQTFDKNIIVVGKKFEKNINNYIPSYWGIIVVKANKDEEIKLYIKRVAKNNKKIKFKSLTDLLWNSEIKSLLRENKIKGYSRKNKNQLVEMLQENFQLDTIKKYTYDTLKSRTDWRVD